jgi:hypothetical protein
MTASFPVRTGGVEELAEFEWRIRGSAAGGELGFFVGNDADLPRLGQTDERVKVTGPLTLSSDDV